jgi:CarD family transcriptional regulator
MFSVGDAISHPVYGAGVIDGICERVIDGVTRSFYHMELQSHTSVLIPVDFSPVEEQAGLRPITDCGVCESLLLSLPSLEVSMVHNWNQRSRENIRLVHSGDLKKIAAVIKLLYIRESVFGLSAAERKTFKTAKSLFISEICLSTGKTPEEIDAYLASCFVP